MKKLSFILYCLLLSNPALSKVTHPQETDSFFSIKLISPYKQVKKGADFLIGIQIKMEKNWYTYWSYPGDFGITPYLEIPSLKSVQIKQLSFPHPQRKRFLLEKKSFYSFVYYNELLIPLKALIQNDYQKDSLALNLNLEWGICKEVCLSKKSSVQLNLKIGPDFQEDKNQKITFDSRENHSPQPAKALNLKTNFIETETKQLLSFFFESEINCLDLLPRSRLDFSTQKPKLTKQTADSCSFEIMKTKSSAGSLSGLLVYSQNQQIQSIWFSSHKKENFALLWFIVMAFLGGLILNFMPCVLPIIFLKFYNNLEIKDFSRKKQLLLNGSYSAGVILSFLVLALFIFISKKTGESLGWGFHLQSPLFVSLLALLFTVMGFYLLEAFSFSSPKLPKLFKDQKIFSHFLTGVLSTTAASPCTVPFMASAMGFAFSRSYLEVFSIFFFLGLGLSSPYLLLSLFPQILRYIPSPGAWSQLVKKLFSIPLFLTSLWLISILYLQINSTSFLFTLLIFPLLTAGIFLPKKLSNLFFKKSLSFGSIFLILCILIFQSRFTHFENSPRLEKDPLADSRWQAFDENKVLYDQTKGKNIFIAFGAEWCITCKFNERIFKTTDFESLVNKYKIQLYYGDWTNKIHSITSFLERQSRQGVPFYIFYKGEERLFLFPAVLTQKNFLEKLEELSQ